jgi:hypothetical protein
LLAHWGAVLQKPEFARRHGAWPLCSLPSRGAKCGEVRGVLNFSYCLLGDFLSPMSNGMELEIYILQYSYTRGPVSYTISVRSNE